VIKFLFLFGAFCSPTYAVFVTGGGSFVQDFQSAIFGTSTFFSGTDGTTTLSGSFSCNGSPPFSCFGSPFGGSLRINGVPFYSYAVNGSSVTGFGPGGSTVPISYYNVETSKSCTGSAFRLYCSGSFVLTNVLTNALTNVPVPEPAAWELISISLFGLGCLRARRPFCVAL
jgi:hypothetical protein